ncbi:MAG: hypothetical protein HYZ53_07760 [Planctomycetes bacterium]|nr:hypothetical protein [Planctomycetota bacterium]
MKNLGLFLLCVSLAGVALAEGSRDPKKLPTIKWDEVNKVSKADAAAAGDAKAAVTVAWQEGETWSVEVYRKDTAGKTPKPRWLPVPAVYSYKVLGSERQGLEQVVKVEVTVAENPEAKVTLSINATTRAIVSAVRGDKPIEAGAIGLPGVWSFPNGKLEGKAYASTLGVPRDAVIFGEGIVGFPAADVPQAGGKVVDVEFKDADGEDCYQRYDEEVAQFPLCSFTLDRVVLLRTLSKKDK